MGEPRRACGNHLWGTYRHNSVARYMTYATSSSGRGERRGQHASMYDIHASTTRNIQGPELIAGGGALIQGAVPVYCHKTLVLRHLHLKQQRPLRESTKCFRACRALLVPPDQRTLCLRPHLTNAAPCRTHLGARMQKPARFMAWRTRLGLVHPPALAKQPQRTRRWHQGQGPDATHAPAVHTHIRPSAVRVRVLACVPTIPRPAPHLPLRLPPPASTPHVTADTRRQDQRFDTLPSAESVWNCASVPRPARGLVMAHAGAV